MLPRYKPYGAAVIDANGTKDANEFFNVSKDAILKVPDSAEPDLPTLPLVDQHAELLESYMRMAHAVAVDVVLGVLNKGLSLKERTLRDMHRLEKPSGDQVRFVKAPPLPEEERQKMEQDIHANRPLLGAHTDFGSVTVLFAKVGGLQVLLPPSSRIASNASNDTASQKTNGNTNVSNEGQWVYVRPIPGHAIVNLGDALVYFSAGMVRSALHRIVSPPGAQAQSTKYSVVYFCRPEDSILFQPLTESEVVQNRVDSGQWKADNDKGGVSAREWVLRKALGIRRMRKWEDSSGTENTTVLSE